MHLYTDSLRERPSVRPSAVLLLPQDKGILGDAILSEKSPPTTPEVPQFEDAKSPDYKSVFATGVFGGLTPDDPKIIFFLDRVVTKTSSQPIFGEQKISKVIREALVEVHMTPTQFKRIALWMTQNVTLYEEYYGTIPTEPKKIISETTEQKTPSP